MEEIMRTIRTALMGAAGTLFLAGGLLAQHAKKPHPKIKESVARATWCVRRLAVRSATSIVSAETSGSRRPSARMRASSSRKSNGLVR